MASQARTALVISAASSGNNTLLAANSIGFIRVHSFTIVAASAVNVRFESGADGTALTGVMTLAQGIPMVVNLEREGHFQTASNVLLNLELSGAVLVSGFLTYSLVEG